MKTSEKIEYLKESRAAAIRSAIVLGQDLVEAVFVRCCCSECAKLRGRWFSISGKDKRFPKLPINYGCTCFGLTFTGVFYDSLSISNPNCRGVEMIEISNRPFVDDRTWDEIEYSEIKRLRTENELFWEEYDDRWKAIAEYDRKQYAILLKYLPDDAPKSYNGYMRMKKGNTKKYQSLAQKALQKNIFLDYPAEMKKELEILIPIRNIYIEVLSQLNKREIEYRKKLKGSHF